MSQKQNKLTQTGIVALLACVCCILWGSAIPVIKTGYHLLQVDSSDTASQIVFAGIRFTLAGILVLIFASIREKKVIGHSSNMPFLCVLPRQWGNTSFFT